MSIDVLDYVKFEKTALNSKPCLEKFFIEFSKYYVKSPRDFLTISQDFYSAMQAMKGSFKHANALQQMTFEKRILPFCLGRHRLLNPQEAYLNEQSPFVSIVTQLISSKNRVLDVGGGAVPYSSILLADYFKQVGAMDKFVVSEKALDTTGIESRDTFFDDVTPIENFDYVVGRGPCSAIRSIVKNCSENNRGYLIKLCNCDLGNIAKNENGGVYKPWTEILPEIDSSVQFSAKRDYAYNLDISPSTFAKIEEDSKEKDVDSLKNTVFGDLKEYGEANSVEMMK